MFPTIVTIGPVTIYSFGLLLGLGLLVAVFYVWKYGRNTALSEERVLDAAFLTILGGLAGARALYVFSNWSLFSEDIGTTLQFWRGGLSFWGAVLGGLVVLFILARKLRWPVGSLVDLAAPAAALGSSIGYVGALLNGSAYGAPTDLPWGVKMLGLPELRNPTQIIEAILLFLIFIICVRIRSHAPFYGFLGYVFLILYSLGRFLIEPLRGDRTIISGDFSQAQLISLVIGLGSLALLYLRLARLQGSWRISLSRIMSPRRFGEY